MLRFLPNECFVCKSRDKLIICECNMISYCSEDHRIEHLPVHESFCKVIKELLINKKLSHIHEELYTLGGLNWRKKRDKISIEVTNKLGRPMNLLENSMWEHPRLCFTCRQTRQSDLTNCPRCPVASFCKKHSENKIHNMNCKVLNRYLNILNAAEKLNVDLKFLSPTFPCITEEEVTQFTHSLTFTYEVNDMQDECLKSRLLKMDLISFMDLASKLNNVLLKTHETIPEELIIHIDALTYEHALTKENYWEFLLHLNLQIKKLKIVITETEKRNNSKTSLCENCISGKKELIVEYSSKSYEDYIEDENYQIPDILFYLKIVDECNSEKRNQWSKFDCPVILRFDTNPNFCQTLQFLSLSTAKFKFIYEGQVKTPFSTLSSIENKDYFIILQSKKNKVLEKSCDSAAEEICEATNTTSSSLSEIESIDTKTHQCGKNSSNSSKTTPSESKGNSDNLEKHTESSKNIIEKEKINTIDTEAEKNDSNEKEENREDRLTLSPSSSVRSFVIISESRVEKEDEENAKASKIQDIRKCLESIDNKFLDLNDEERKITEEDNRKEKKNIEERKEREEETVNFSQSFVIGHVSYLKNENEGLRQQLNLSFNEITKLQTKLNQVCFELNKKEKVINKLLRVIVESKDTDLQCEENEI